jgi:hypothetical protein
MLAKFRIQLSIYFFGGTEKEIPPRTAEITVEDENLVICQGSTSADNYSY